MLTLVSLINLITATISIGFLFIHQIFKSKKMPSSQSLCYLYNRALKHLAISGNRAAPENANSQDACCNPLLTPVHAQYPLIYFELQDSGAFRKSA